MISIHASRVGGDDELFRSGLKSKISIHASRVGGDKKLVSGNQVKAISIHASRVGGDADGEEYSEGTRTFQSTPPGWEATCFGFTPAKHNSKFQSTPPGWEATF